MTAPTTTDPSQPQGASRAAVGFIFVTVLLDMLAFGVIIPVLPNLVKTFQGGDTVAAANTLGVFNTMWAAMQFVCAPIIGSLSDRFGRRKVILGSNFGLGADFVLMAMAPNLTWLFVGRVLSGMTSASFATAGAYIADVTPPAQRAAKFGMLGAAFGIGFICGPALGGFLASFNLRAPFWVGAGLCLANALYGMFVLPESLPKERRMAFSWKRANPIGSLKLLSRHHELIGLASVMLLYFIAHNSLPAVFVLYADYRYAWGEQTVGYVLAGVGVCSMIVQMGLVGKVVGWFGERRTLCTGLLFGATAFAIYGIAPTGMVFLLGIPFGALMGIVGPAMGSLMSRRVSHSEQGQLQGANGSIMAIAGMLAPALFTQVFAYGIRPSQTFHMPGAPYLVASAIVVVSCGVAWVVTRPRESAATAA
ncbi:MAG TPA: TCR/Tet family MFS transporter [Gemmatimonadaceae bacterium]|nr:TCR/Tet family MFS transporter [Gemmatimonadaceae bacterium]